MVADLSGQSPKMDFVFREAGPSDHRAIQAAMLEIFRETQAQKGALFEGALWEWQYMRAERSSFVVVAERNRELCGYYHVLLLPMRYLERGVLGAMVQDVATMRDHRGLGILRGMGAYALDRMRARGVDLAYTFPNSRSLPAFIRDHDYAVAAPVPVRIVPLNVGSMLKRRTGLPGAKALGAPVRALSSFLAGASSGGLGGDVERLDRLEEVERVARSFAGSGRIAVDRSASFLGWRFLEKPTREYTVWGLRRGGELKAYVITRHATLFSSSCLLLMDLGCIQGEEAALGTLIRARLAAARGDGVELAVTMGLHPFFSRLRGLGFVSVPGVLNPRRFRLVVRPVSPDVGQELLEPSQWLITLADWDVL